MMRIVELDTRSFQEALDRSVDELKPDPLVQRQLQTWNMKWELEDSSGCPADALFTICGKLKVSGQYNFAPAVFFIKCWWNKVNFSVQCLASISFERNDSADKHVSRMRRRLEDDDYIMKVQKPTELFVATILHSEDELEERVDCNDTVGEGIKRLLLSQADSSLDLFEILLGMPFLPVTKSDLAKRAKLRLLEDAMCSECEKEEEDTLVSDLDVNEAQQKKKRR